jgi:hypothetical protein
MPRIHPTITDARVIDAVERQQHDTDNPGFCLRCGAEQEGCEPEAEQYRCESCGQRAVYGAEQVLLMLA